MLLTVLVGSVDGVREFHLSSAAFGAEDHRDDAEGKADGSERPPEPSKIHSVVAPSVVLAVASIA